MAAVWWRARAELRRRWVGTLVLVLLVGLVGSVVIAAVAGARRTSTAPERLVAEIGAPIDALVFDVGDADPEQLGSLPQVTRSEAITFLAVDAADSPGSLVAFAATDPGFGGLLVEGSPPDLDDPLAAAIDEPAARQFGVEVGDEILLSSYTAEQFASFDLVGGPLGPPLTARVAAVLREPDDITPGDPSAKEQVGYAANSSLYLPAVFLERYDEVATVNTLLGFQLGGGPFAAADFTAAVRELPGGETVQFFEGPQVDPATQRAVDVQSLGLVLFAIALGLAGALSVGLGVSRQLRVDDADGEALRALGMSSWQRTGVAALRGAVLGVAGGSLAVLGAVLWSPLTPVGLARQAEPQPGVDVNVAVLAVGGVLIAVVFAGWAALSGWSMARRRRRQVTPGGRPGFAEQAARAGATPSLVTGLALAGHRRRGTSTPTALAGVAVGVAALVAAGTFITSLDFLVDEPERYGWAFDAVAGSPFDGDAGELEANLAGAAGIEARALSGSVAVQSGGRDFGVVGVEAGRGIPLAPIQDGREPLGRREIALGSRTLEQLDKDVGDTLEVDAGRGPIPLTITGTAIIPEIGAAGPGFSEGGVVTLESFEELSPEAPHLVLLELAPDLGSAELDEVRDRSGGLLLQPVLPVAVYDMQRIRGLPVLLAALLALLALAALVHTLVSTVRTRRRDLAVLKTVGFVRHQIVASTIWVATAFVIVALVVGLPLGVVLGRSVWLVLVDRLGAESRPAVPVVLLVVLVPLALLVASMAAAVPGWLAARIRPAVALRTE